MPALITKFVKVAQSGPTVDGRNIDPQWLRDMAEIYDPALYRAKIWPDHLRWGNNYGSVVALKSEEKDGLVSLYASFAPNAQYLLSNQYDQKLSFSIEVLENFAGTGKFYLGGLGVTDSPASLGTDELKFSRRASYNGQSARIFAGEPVDASCFSADPASDTAEAPGWFITFVKKFLPNEEPPMDQKQFDAMNKRIEGLEGQLGEIKTLVEGKFAAAPAATTAPAAAGEPKPGTSQPDGKQPQGETGQDFAAMSAAFAASMETAVAPLRQKLDEMDKRFAAAKPGAPVAESTGPADDNTPLI
ncbi:GPO family capsid scaffolding protein [Desulfovibrio sp. QI0430]